MSRTSDILEFIRQYREENGMAPSLRELAANFKTSTSVIHYHISKLVADGKLKRVPGVARGLVPTDKENDEFSKTD